MNGNNDPSAGSPTETLLRLILPLSVMACTTFWTSSEVQSEELAETLESVGATGGVYNISHPKFLALKVIRLAFWNQQSPPGKPLSKWFDYILSS
jgi:hypothetical protein